MVHARTVPRAPPDGRGRHDDPHGGRGADRRAGREAVAIEDFRARLDRKDLDAVIVATPGCVVSWSTREVNQGGRAGLVFYGTKGTLDLDRSSYAITPETWTGQDPADPTKKFAPAIEARTVKGEHLDDQHVRNFLDCVKSRQRPNADVEEGHLSAALCHLGNLSTRLGRSLAWDAERERVKDDDEANRLLTKQYRRPWMLEGL